MYGTTILFLMLLIQSTKADDEEMDKIFHSPNIRPSIMEPEIVAHINGCIFKTNEIKSFICTGTSCQNFSLPPNIQPEVLVIKTTKISNFGKNDFKNFTRLHTLEIEFNVELMKLETGCFKNLSTLTKLSISFNINLQHFDENVFDGLINLKEIYLLKNGFARISDITKALQPLYVPALMQLHLNENVFGTVDENDFKPMAGSTLQELRLILCLIDYIHPKSFNPLKQLKTLCLGQNQFSEETIGHVIAEMLQQKIPLESLSIDDAGFRRATPFHLLTLIGQMNITHLNMSHNIFDNLNSQSFPKMPNIVELDLSTCLLLDVADGTFANLPNLKTLLLNENRLPIVSTGVTLKQLKHLDISGNSGNQISRSYFRVDDNIFSKMSNLEELQLAYNLITQINSATFNGLINLKYLGLKNATIFSMEPRTFSHLKKLEYLNLESNKFTVLLTAEMFQGLNNLKTLLLGDCAIEHLSTMPSPFDYLTNLTFLGLQGNCLYTITSSIFLPLKELNSLDLSQNKFLEWSDEMFKNVSVKNINLSQNKIKTVTEIMLEDFKFIETLNIDGNPFTCDCLLLPAAKWLHNHNFSFNYIRNNGLNAKCVNPDEWSQISILNYMIYIRLKTEECEIMPINMQTVLISLLSVSSVIIVTLSVLAYKYRLHLRHWLLLTRMAIRRYLRSKKNNTGFNTNELGDIYKYDAFVSYSNEDQSFVEHLVAMLETHEPYFKLCVYERDFQIGSAISESVLHSVSSSKRTILIVSDSFAKSQWCRWEAKLAQHHHLFFQDGDIKGPHGTLLMILLKDVDSANNTPTLKYLLKTRIYLQWSSNAEDQRIFWEKLRKKLSTPNNGSYESCMTISDT